MRELFNGWKRKLGVVTLVVACVFMAGWVRSGLIEDRIGRNLRSRNGAFAFYEDSSPGMLEYDATLVYSAADSELAVVQQTPTVFTLTVEEAFGPRIRWKFPYWSIVLPLTLLSAWLLLSKPRTTTKVRA